MTRMVDRLETKGLVQRHRCTRDRRQISLELTERGKALVPKMKAIAIRVDHDALRGLTGDDVRNLHVYLTRILEKLRVRVRVSGRRTDSQMLNVSRSHTLV